jgi:hypothetical protein
VVCGVGQEQLEPSYFFISLVLGPLNSLVWWEELKSRPHAPIWENSNNVDPLVSGFGQIYLTVKYI